MIIDWSQMSEDMQLMLSREAMLRATDLVAGHAEALAREIEAGGLEDRGGPDALRLLASVLRLNSQDLLGPVGNA
ncbi:MAG TPA: hypothetical protein VMI52_05440 [Acetobacteraceae bacterium]|nr:hypothetical protein [Acetobacteraceae bacterium]